MHIGVNLAPIRAYLPSPFIDITRSSMGFKPQIEGKGTVLPNGWPAGDGAGEMAGLFYFPPEAHNYTVICTKGAISSIRVIKTSQRITLDNNWASFDMPAVDGYQQINITPIAGSGETRVAIIRTDWLDLWKNGEIFDPEWLKSLADFESFRLLDWLETNGNLTVDTFVPADSWFLAKTGAPIELAIALANKTGAGLHIPIPAHASDQWVKTLIGKLKTGLEPGIMVLLEYGNEVWNGGFEANKYAIAQSLSLWGDVNSRGYMWYGYRAGQIALLARGSGYRVGIGCQTAQPAMADKVWAGVKLSGATNADFTDWLIAAYVNGTLTSKAGPTLDLAARGDVDAGIENILHTGTGSVDAQGKLYAAHKTIAAANFLKLTVYEGNAHLNALPNFAGDTLGTVLGYFKKLTTSEGMAKVMEANLQALEANGVELFHLYGDRQNYTGFGCFGMVGTPAWDKLKEWISAEEESLEDLVKEIETMQAQLADLRQRVEAAL